MAKLASPCIGVCTFRRPGPAGRHCIACSMTKAQRGIAKAIRKPAAMAGFVALVMAQQAMMGRYAQWRPAYLRRSMKKGRTIPDVARRD